jgi:hypothetical protein
MDLRFLALLVFYVLESHFLMKINITIVQFLDLGPTRVKLQVMLFGKPNGTVALVGGGADSLVSPAEPDLGHGQFSVGGYTFRHSPGCLVGYVPAAFYVGSHVGTMVLHRLEATYGSAELGALLHVLDSHLQHRIGAAQHLYTFTRNSSLDGTLNNRPPLVCLSQH